jgi:hypothetical protein
MLLTSEQMKNELKRSNVSKDTEKTKERIKTDFTAASAEQKRAIADVSGQGLGSFYRVYEKGTVTPRVVLALASELNVSPLFYTGDTDEKEPCSDALVIQFLIEKGYKKLASELSSNLVDKPKRKYNRKPKIETPVTENIVEESDNTANSIDEPVDIPKTIEESVDISNSIEDSVEHDLQIIKENLPAEPEMDIDINAISEDDAVFLLKAMFIRSKAGASRAANDLKAVLGILLS